MFKVVEKLKEKTKNMYGAEAITIAFLGDSVTQGCFECYLTSPTSIGTVFDYKNAYSTRLKDILNMLYPNVQINIINSGISGDDVRNGEKRLERDILSYNPDLVIVSYGLNDSTHGMDGLDAYTQSLSKIFAQLQERDIDVVFLTQNMMNSNVSSWLKEPALIDLAENFSKNIQNNGVLHSYFEAATKVCDKYNVKVCDLHSIWESLERIGVNTTELLANKLNHPIREMHYYMAIKLLETILL